MKRIVTLILMAGILISCSDDNTRKSESSEFLGKWGLSEILIDPGDGSGVYQPVDTFDAIEFLPNGTISSNYSLCPFYNGNATQFTTPYDADLNVILPNNCFQEGDTISYTISGENLILYYPCVEACAYKFVRIEE